MVFKTGKDRLLPFSSFVILLLLASGCSQLKNAQDKMNQMASTTADVSKTSNKMANTTDHMSKETDDMDRKTTDLLGLSSDLDHMTLALYIKERQAGALEVRKDMINQMNAATTMEAKISYAASYFMAFEFQVWGGASDDNQARLEDLYNCALQEFFRTATQFMPDNYRSHPEVDPTSQKNRDMDLYALAVAMHELNPYSQPQLVDPSMRDAIPQKVSMLTLIKRGLTKLKAVNSGAIKDGDLKDWQKEVLNDEQAFEYLIRVRANFLPVMVLAQVSNLSHRGILGIPQLFDELRMSVTGWTADLADLNAEQIVTITKWLTDPQGALAARAELENLGVDANINPKVLRLYRKMRFDDSGVAPAILQPGPNGSASTLDQFKTAVKDLING